MDLNKGIERLTLLLSILVGTTIVFFTTLSDYTLNGTLKGPLEVFFGLLFLWSVGFASVWAIYGAAMFLVKGFYNLSEIQQDQEVSDVLAGIPPQYQPLPKREVAMVQVPEKQMPWRDEIDKVRIDRSKIRAKLIDKAEKVKLVQPKAAAKVIKFNCKYCGQKITVPDIHAGKKGQCLKCKNVLIIPQARKPEHAAAWSNPGNEKRPMRPTFVPREKVEAEERARTKAWEAIRDEVASQTKAELNSKAEIKELVRSEMQNKAAVKARPKTLAQAKAHAVLEAIENARAEAEARIRAEAEMKAKEIAEALEKVRIETEAKIRAEAQAKVKPPKKTDAKAKPATKAEAKLKPKITAKSETKAKSKAKVKAEPKVKAKAQNKTAAKAKAKAKSKSATAAAKSKPAAKVESQPKSEPSVFNILEVMQKVKKNTKMSKV